MSMICFFFSFPPFFPPSFLADGIWAAMIGIDILTVVCLMDAEGIGVYTLWAKTSFSSSSPSSLSCRKDSIARRSCCYLEHRLVCLTSSFSLGAIWMRRDERRRTKGSRLSVRFQSLFTSDSIHRVRGWWHCNNTQYRLSYHTRIRCARLNKSRPLFFLYFYFGPFFYYSYFIFFPLHLALLPGYYVRRCWSWRHREIDLSKYSTRPDVLRISQQRTLRLTPSSISNVQRRSAPSEQWQTLSAHPTTACKPHRYPFPFDLFGTNMRNWESLFMITYCNL